MSKAPVTQADVRKLIASYRIETSMLLAYRDSNNEECLFVLDHKLSPAQQLRQIESNIAIFEQTAEEARQMQAKLKRN